MFYKMKANTIKLMINSFANGNLELVKQFHLQYGKEVFEYVPELKNTYHKRLIFYSFKGCHLDVIDYYLSLPNPTPPSEVEIGLICRSLAKPGKLNKFLEERSELYKSILPDEKVIEKIKYYVAQSYNLELIDEYLEKYPNEINSLLKGCSSSSKGTQLRRHLQLKQLINE